MRRTFCLSLVICIALLAASSLVAQSSDPLVATWTVNMAKSKYDPPSLAVKSNSSKWESMAGSLMVTTDGMDAQGKPTHTEIMMKFDGKEAPLKGAPAPNTTRVYTRIDQRTFEFVTKVGGKVTTTTRSVMSADGKTRTLTATGKNADGQTVKNVTVWEKQ